MNPPRTVLGIIFSFIFVFIFLCIFSINAILYANLEYGAIAFICLLIMILAAYNLRKQFV